MLIPLIKKKTPLIDLRAPVEFSSRAVPTSINLPILDDEERSIVGKTYKDINLVSPDEYPTMEMRYSHQNLEYFFLNYWMNTQLKTILL